MRCRVYLAAMLILVAGCKAVPRVDADQRPTAAGVIAVHQKIPAK